MTSYQTFAFAGYDFDPVSKQATFRYALDDVVRFSETYTFDFDFVDYSTEQLDTALQNLFFMAGVSYYKAYLPPTIAVQAGQLDATQASFFANTYQRGLGEFLYVNQLDPRLAIPFAATVPDAINPQTAPVKAGLLVGLGGGKDSLVSLSLLAEQPNVATWSLGHHDQLQALIERVGLPHLQVSRRIDQQLIDLNSQGAYNGHVPISAILACVGTVVGILAGYATAVVSNEHSANEPTLEYDGVAINHQFSKSLEFERDYQALLVHCFGSSLRYFSLLRPLSELRIAELFAQHALARYHDVFSSCNRAFIQASTELSWCGICPKCAFVFLALTPFVERATLEAIWGGKNLLLDPELAPTYRQLLGIEGDKPLECVGEIKESRAAMRLAQQQYPELATYEFNLPADYDFRELAEHAIPAEFINLVG